jgi:hypothetical protein
MKKYLFGERGNVESALTLIPLMILFLSVLQVGIGVYSRMTVEQSVQSFVAVSAMGLVPDSAPISAGVVSIPLPGGGSLLTGTNQTHIPSITPLLPSGDHIKSTGVAVQE